MRRQFQFFKEFIHTPANIGAICPSSRRLAKTVCSMLPQHIQGTIIEIGPGTGAITNCLVRHVNNPEQLLLVERSSSFVQSLKDTYPELSIINGDAAELHRLVPEYISVSAIVSSMPLLTIEQSYKEKILQQFHSVLSSTGQLIFISYNMRCNTSILDAGFINTAHTFVFRNVPPARIDCFIPA